MSVRFLTAEQALQADIESLQSNNNWDIYTGLPTFETPNGVLTAFTFIASSSGVLAGWDKSAIYKDGIRVMTSLYVDSGAAIEFTVAPTSTQIVRGDFWVLNT